MNPTKLKIRLYGDPCLRKKSSVVESVGPAERILIKAMIQTMYDAKGIGLAAPQVGINKQIFVADLGDGPFAVINPKIKNVSGETVMEEGCLSIPEITVDVVRPEKICVEYMDEEGKQVEKNCDELLARVILHETDHLMGKLILDYQTEETLKELKPHLDELEKKSRV